MLFLPLHRSRSRSVSFSSSAAARLSAAPSRKNRFAGVDAFLRLRSLEEERRQAREQAVWNNRNRLERGNPAKVFRETF